jgi:hypothetical protein
MDLYLLMKRNRTAPEQPEVVVGWTVVLNIAIHWRQSAHMHEDRWFDSPKEITAKDLQ